MNKLFTTAFVLGFFAAGAALANPGAGPGAGGAAGAAGAASGSGYQVGVNNTSPSRPTPDNSAFDLSVIHAPTPYAGANNLAESEARVRIGEYGYTGITGLSEDAQSVWHGQAMLNGNPVNIALDTRGNVVIE